MKKFKAYYYKVSMETSKDNLCIKIDLHNKELFEI